jgi:hypothetical protein
VNNGNKPETAIAEMVEAPGLLGVSFLPGKGIDLAGIAILAGQIAKQNGRAAGGFTVS